MEKEIDIPKGKYIRKDGMLYIDYSYYSDLLGKLADASIRSSDYLLTICEMTRMIEDKDKLNESLILQNQNLTFRNVKHTRFAKMEIVGCKNINLNH